MTWAFKFWRRFTVGGRGAVAIEAALILPVMVVMLTGLIELSYLMMAERRVSGAAHSTADLIAQETDVTSTDLSDIFSAAALIMAPFDTANLTIGVSSVRFDDTTGNPSQDWSSAYNAGTVSNPTTLATGMGEAGSSVIIVTATYTYTPILSAVLSGPYTLSETAITRPRYLPYVGFY